MIKDHFLPIAVKLRENGQSVDYKDKKLLASKHGSNEVADLEAEVQTVSILFSPGGGTGRSIHRLLH